MRHGGSPGAAARHALRPCLCRTQQKSWVRLRSPVSTLRRSPALGNRLLREHAAASFPQGIASASLCGPTSRKRLQIESQVHRRLGCTDVNFSDTRTDAEAAFGWRIHGERETVLAASAYKRLRPEILMRAVLEKFVPSQM